MNGGAIRFSKQMTRNSVLKFIAFPPPKEHFLPSTNDEGRVIPPRISYQFQWRIRRACEAAEIDAEKVVGLPSLPVRPLMPKHLLQKGNNRPMEKLKRQEKIQENMAQMPKRIEQYRKERIKNKNANKPDMPF